jgi:N-acetylmuramic acid 6-phosphate etherase
VSAAELDLLPTGEVVGLLLAAEERVLPAVRAAAPRIAAAAELVADRMRGGGRLLLVGAGTSGRLAVLEAAELPGTYGLDPASVRAVVAGGLTGTDRNEDDTDAGRGDLAAVGAGPADVVVAVAASGRTPYTLAAASAATRAGVAVVAVTTTVPSPLAAVADVAIEVPTGPEVLNGSTRLTAGTAQKVALDALTTAAMVRLGRVHANVMIDVVAANAKLRDRSAGQVAVVVGCPPEQAREALERCDWNARAAVLVLVAGLTPAEAAALAARHPTLRAAMAAAHSPVEVDR